MTDPAHRHGGPDAGWYVPDGHGWQRISDGEVGDHGDAAHFMTDPNGRHETPAFLVDLNAARSWWLDNMPWIGRVPTDHEVLARWRAAVL